MKTLIQIPALVEATSSDEMVTTTINLSTKDGQVTIEIPEWETRFEVPAEHLGKALAELHPTEGQVNLTMVQHLGQKLSRLEQQVAATPQQRLEIEAINETIEAFRSELQNLKQARIDHNARLLLLQGNSSENDAAIVELENTAQNFGDRIAVLENNLAEPPAEAAAVALYGGEQ